MRRRAVLIGLAIVCVAAAGGTGRLLYKQLRWKNFAEVKKGSIYRSGQLTSWQLARAIDSLGLKTVVCLHPEAAKTEAEICAAKGVDFVFLPMPASGLGEREQFEEILKTARDPKRRPMLLHCFAGVARTGAAIALLRMIEDGWSIDEALAELRSFERRGRLEPDLERHIRLLRQELTKDAARAPATSVRR